MSKTHNKTASRTHDILRILITYKSQLDYKTNLVYFKLTGLLQTGYIRGATRSGNRNKTDLEYIAISYHSCHKESRRLLILYTQAKSKNELKSSFRIHMEIGTGERGPQTEMLEFKVTSKPELRFEH